MTKGANLCQQVIVISEGFVCVCMLQDGTQSDNIGLKIYMYQKHIICVLRACRPSDKGHLSAPRSSMSIDDMNV